jgi:predicted amidohydrolase
MKIQKAIKKARSLGVDILTFPELAICVCNTGNSNLKGVYLIGAGQGAGHQKLKCHDIVTFSSYIL